MLSSLGLVLLDEERFTPPSSPFLESYLSQVTCPIICVLSDLLSLVVLGFTASFVFAYITSIDITHVKICTVSMYFIIYTYRTCMCLGPLVV